VKLTIQTLNSKSEVIATLPFADNDEVAPHVHVLAAVQKAQEMLHEVDFKEKGGLNTCVKQGEQTCWLSYYKA
jgi:hypothetical protein